MPNRLQSESHLFFFFALLQEVVTFCSSSKQHLSQSHIFSSKSLVPAVQVKGLSIQLQISFCNSNSFMFKLSFRRFIHLQHTPSDRAMAENSVLMFSLPRHYIQPVLRGRPLCACWMHSWRAERHEDLQQSRKSLIGYSYRCRKTYNIIGLQLPSYALTLPEELLNA